MFRPPSFARSARPPSFARSARPLHSESKGGSQSALRRASPDRSHPLRLATIGGVDDGKSTLIGRLLHDSRSIFEDQLEHLEAVSRRRGHHEVDLALLTDGLRAEREQGITIDVAYRYFSTPHRDFVVADCPGHVQYTRNMVTGVSRVDLAVILVDARRGVVEQTRRHLLISALMRTPRFVVAVNKMDLVDHDQQRFAELGDEVRRLVAALDADIDVELDVAVLPISALTGDNVVERSQRMPWYDGPTLLHHLETVDLTPSRPLGSRLPVQHVVRPQGAGVGELRRYAGTVAAGTVRRGDDVLVLPAGTSTSIAAIETADGCLVEASAGRAVTVVLADDVDVARGDLIVDAADPPTCSQQFTASLAWLDGTPLAVARPYRLKHTSRTVRGVVTAVEDRLDVERLGARRPAETLSRNDVGTVSLQTTEPVVIDDFRRSRSTGSFVLIDETTHQTVAGGMVRLHDW